MTHEESLKDSLLQKFGFPLDKVRIQRDRRILLDAEANNFKAVLEYCINELGFSILCTITGMDETDKMSFIYHMAREDGIMLNIRISIPKDKLVLKTITDKFPSADAYERELVDLLGIKVEGLAEGKRYPLPDDWPAGEYPLRKDWKPKST